MGTEEDQIMENIQSRGKSIIIWPFLSQAYGAILVLVTRPLPMLQLTVKESAGLSLIYVTLVLAGAYLILYLLRKGLIKFLQLVFLGSLFASSMLSLNQVLSGIKYNTLISFLVSISLILLWKRPGMIGNLVKTIFSASISYVIVSTFPDAFILFLLGFLAVYDAYSVFKGPLGEIFDSLELRIEVLSPLLVTQQGIGLGIGDLLVYSLAASFSAKSIGFPLVLLPLASLNIGILITLNLLLKRKSPLPGVTIPMALWIPCFLLAKLLHFLGSS